MDFDHLPPNIFLQILRLLPIEKQAQIGRVNKTFRRMSSIVLSEVKSIQPSDGQFKRMDAQSFSNLVRLCKSNLKEIRIGLSGEWLGEFAQFFCPNLVDLHIDTRNDDNNFAGAIVANNRNSLKNIVWFDYSTNGRPWTFPDAVCAKLETLSIYAFLLGESLTSLAAGRCHNFKKIRFCSSNASADVSGRALDQFFASCPNLEAFETVLVVFDVRYAQLSHFWQLSSMRSLQLAGSGETALLDDRDLIKISTHFRHLETLILRCTNATNDGFFALSTLENLRELRLGFITTTDRSGSVDLGVRRLAYCEHLQILDAHVNITPTTFVTMVQHCRKLRRFSIKNIEMETIDSAVDMLRSFDGFVKRHIKIIFGTTNEIRESEQVKAILDALKANNGPDIEMKVF